MNAGQPLPAPATSTANCEVCHDVANVSTVVRTDTCGDPAHRLIESLKRVIDRHDVTEDTLRGDIEILSHRFEVEKAHLKERNNALEKRLRLRGEHTERVRNHNEKLQEWSVADFHRPGNSRFDSIYKNRFPKRPGVRYTDNAAKRKI